MRGFTLIELSIVLVIIGLLVAGVTGGSYLLNQYRLRVVINEQNYYNAAINNFMNQYGQLPGDFNAASTMWPNCYTTPANCNGNNDGLILRAQGNQYTDESIRAWQHLYLAGHIDQNMSGYHSVLSENSIGINVPFSKFPGVGWFIDRGLAGELSANNSMNVLTIGGRVSSSVNYNFAFTPFQSQSIDLKIDDGKPFTGKVRGIWNDGVGLQWTTTPVGTTCAISSTRGYNTGAAYIYKKICTLSFRMGLN